jgi:antitoxin component YwqK of YwqJK toxin-antitoxin module
MKKISILLIALFCLISCKTKSTNQTINKKREGLWIENYSIDSSQYESIGSYKNDDPIKKWKYYLNGKLIKKELYYKNFSKIKFFHENRKLESKGNTQLDQNTKKLHWYYSGIWKYYDTQGKLIMTRNYDKGELVSETIMK